MSRLVDIALFERYGDSYIVYSTDDSGNKRTIQTSELTTVIPKTGHFEYDEVTQEYMCSECGHNTCGYFDLEDEAYETEFGTGFRLRHPHYCKHCGAKMEEKDNAE